MSKWKQVVSYLGDGMTNDEIADRIGISARGVRWYTAALMRINGLYGKAEFRKLVSLAARRRLRLPGGTRV